jgi:multiple sugar transport system permease protein
MKKIWKKSLLALVGYATALFFLFPYLEMVITAVKPKLELYDMPAPYFPHTWDWGNFISVWHQIPLLTYLKSSVIISLSATMIVMIVCIPAAYYIARHNFRGRTAFMLLVLITQMFSPTALVIGIYREIVKFHLVDTYLALILINAAFNMAFSIWILSAFFKSIPLEIEEAAFIDGCTRFQTLRRVTLPLAMPGIITAFIFTFIAAWNEFVIAFTVTGSPARAPLTVGITSLVGLDVVQWNYLFAGAIISIIPVVILFSLIERWLVGGLTAGSVK